MRLYYSWLLGVILFFTSPHLAAQSCVPTGNNNAVINFSCGVNCGPIDLQVPHLKSSSTYSLTAIPYAPFPFTSINGTELTVLYNDDEYSEIINLPFSFCFYDSVFSKVVAGSNGLLTFDTANALCANAWTINPPIFFSGGIICNPTSTYYPKSSIMAGYSDYDPRPIASPPDKRIEWRIEGSAPCRKLILSYYRIGVFGNNSCGQNTPNTFQIVIYESTGVIDIFFEDKTCFSTTNGGDAILGIQNWDRDKAVAAPGRNATQWTAHNEGWRFVPSGGASRFIRAELFSMTGNLIAIADTTSSIEGLLDLSFPNICPNGQSEQFVIKTSYSSCGGAGVLEAIDTITVNKGNGLNATTTFTNVDCATAGASGSITVTVASGAGVAPYTYSINGGPQQSNNTFSGLNAGTYTVTATDATGCSFNQSVTINLSGSLIAYASATPTSCSGANNGSIVGGIGGGNPPYSYSLNGGPPQASNIFLNLAAGNYTLTVMDGGGCTGTQNVIVTSGTAGLTAILNNTPASCVGANNGTITVTPTAGSPPFQYAINNGPWQTSNIFTGLAPATYSVALNDVNNCISTFTVIVSGGTSLTATAAHTNVTCNGTNNGTITINVNNGTGPFQYSLDGINFQSSNTFLGLAPGTYTVHFRDNNNCSGTVPATITQPLALVFSTNTQAALCNNQNNGSIIIAASGGTAPYLYSLNGNTYQSANSFAVASGNYTVYVKDNNGCIVTQPVTIIQPSPITLTVTSTNASCNGGPDGVITITAIGGNGNYQYSINGTTFQTTNVFNVIPGPYTVTVKDINNCTANQNITVGLTNNLSIVKNRDTVICEGSSVQLNMVTNANQFSWTPAGSLNNSTTSAPIASPTTTTQYIVTATLGNCSGNDTIIVNVNAAPIADAGPDGDICYGLSYQLQGSGGTQFFWSPATSLDNKNISNPISTPAQTITYNLNVTDANECPSLVSDAVQIKVTPPIIVNTYPSDTIVYAGDQFKIVATSQGTNYTWTPAIGLSSSIIPDPVLTVSSDIRFTVIAETSAGCKGEGIVNIKVYKGPDIYVPTGFTPNGDGRNEIFKPIPVGIKEIKYFRVYNRWGQMIFSSSKLHEGWDGRIQGLLQPTGTYVWMVQGITKDDKIITKRGTVTLLR